MKTIKLMELRPDRSLLDSKFDGYKLSLAEIPTITQQLKVSVNRLLPDINQYSLLHAKLYALHNHLIGNSDEIDSVYFVDKEMNIQKFCIESLTNQFSSVILWKLPLPREQTSGDYNVSLQMASDKIAVMADGMGCLYVLNRGFKDMNDKWTVIFCGEVIGPDEKFIITDVIHKETPKPQLHLLLTSIQQKENERHSTILHWITLEKSDCWNQVALRELTVPGFVQYANLEPSCEAIYVISDSSCKFTLDSENKIQESEEEAEVEKKYMWSQDKDNVTIKFSFPEIVYKNAVNVHTEESLIIVKYGNDTLLEGNLYQRIEPDVTCWSIQNTVLELVLKKTAIGLMWPEVVPGDKTGAYVPDPVFINEAVERLAPITTPTEDGPPMGTTFNSQQIEECDFESDKLTVFERLDRDCHKISHKVNLGSHQVLLTVSLDKELPLALGIRSDVDTCIWQPKVADDFTLEHKGTLLALGYIQASKQQMKFFVCSPSLSYSAISESTKHIFIYYQSKTVGSNELRNRITGCRISAMAQQQVFSLPSNDEILGIYASNSYLYVLGENFITALKL